MWDSSAKSESGLLYGNVYQGGNFDECLSVTHPIRAQFCVLSIQAYVNSSHNGGGDPFDLEPDSESVIWKKFLVSFIELRFIEHIRDGNMNICVKTSINASQ